MAHPNTKNKTEIVKPTKVTYIGIPKLTADFSGGPIEAERQCNFIWKELKERNHQSKILYSAKLLFYNVNMKMKMKVRHFPVYLEFNTQQSSFEELQKIYF